MRLRKRRQPQPATRGKPESNVLLCTQPQWTLLRFRDGVVMRAPEPGVASTFYRQSRFGRRP